MRFVALGDSLTVGLCDPAPGGWRGWARLLADSLDGAQLHNLARCGARAHDVATDRLAQALAARPSLASVVVGVNDTLRGDFSLGQTARDVAYAAAALTQAGAIVLTARLPEPGAMLGLPDVVRRPLARRTRALNAVLDDLARRYGTVHLDIADHAHAHDPDMWGIDRLHPSERGHRMLARTYAERLATLGQPVRGLPDAEPTNPPHPRAPS